MKHVLPWDQKFPFMDVRVLHSVNKCRDDFTLTLQIFNFS